MRILVTGSRISALAEGNPTSDNLSFYGELDFLRAAIAATVAIVLMNGLLLLYAAT